MDGDQISPRSVPLIYSRGMDRVTLDFYNAKAKEMADCYVQGGSGVAELFPIAFPRGTRVLDLGFGSGRDLNALCQAGYEACGVDASAEMVAQARHRFPSLDGRLTLDHLPRLAAVADQAFDGILCSAVLMHLPEELLFDSVLNIRRILKLGGRLLISTPLAGPKVDISTRRDENGRLFNGVTPEQFQFLFEKVGFRQINRWDSADHLNRSDRRWATQLFVLEN